MEGHPETQTKANWIPETLEKKKGSLQCLPPEASVHYGISRFHSSVLTLLRLSSSMRK